MNAWERLAAMPGIHALGWTLLHFCWEGAAVGVALALALAVIPRRAARLRYAAACAAMALMAALPLATFARLALEAGPAGERMAQPTGMAAGVGAGLSPASAETWVERCVEGLNAALPDVIGFWLAGVLILLGRLNVGLLATRRLRARASAAGAEMETLLRRLAERTGVRRVVRLLHSAQVQAPTVMGWLRPAILMPVGCLAGMSAEQVEAVLAHELEHIRRNDYVVGVVQAVVETALFYHPAVWWVSRQMRREREACCDDAAVRVNGDKVAYARALTMLETRRGVALAMSATGGNLKIRIGRMLGVQETPAMSRLGAVGLLVVMLAGAGVLAGAVRAQTTSGPATAQHKTVWQAWVDQDVRWIITPDEKQAFLRLKTDEERREFVKQFWERRNPTPGSAVNEYRAAYYRRMAYANQHFGEGGEQGWATDRGHVYLVYGPPDSIDAYPTGGHGEAAPWETWHYREIRMEKPALSGAPGTGPGKSWSAVLKEGDFLLRDVDFRFVERSGQYRLMTQWPQ
ncbi:MAG TPA: GWxTD domain-containing protein [Acidobacteriaceae bacterium]|nr:GWxTD domain-containing protein [Acidobacteriaceae bacterium]